MFPHWWHYYSFPQKPLTKLSETPDVPCAHTIIKLWGEKKKLWHFYWQSNQHLRRCCFHGAPPRPSPTCLHNEPLISCLIGNLPGPVQSPLCPSVAPFGGLLLWAMCCNFTTPKQCVPRKRDTHEVTHRRGHMRWTQNTEWGDINVPCKVHIHPVALSDLLSQITYVLSNCTLV